MKKSSRIALSTSEPRLYTHRKLFMKTPFRSAPVAPFLLLFGVFAAGSIGVREAAAQGTAAAISTSTSSNAQSRVRFRPPTSGATSVRVTGGSRGQGDQAIALDVLAPDDIGTTTQEQPSLFWFQSRPADAKFELTLLQEKTVKPVVQIKMDRASKAGIQRLKLSDHGVTLQPGTEYQWVVALVTDPDNRSTDQVASGVIKHVPLPKDLKKKIAGASPASLASLYAEAGIWYDALAAISNQIESQPDDSSLRQARADLLRQVGLNTAAQAEAAR
jgi:hypothetical protein